ncbi:DeoR/GlpR transcriptional regulator [Schaalia sp. ZJ405]|uniref:DeoR/GlpR family DNA-binding transcription regulator n=1 Tax=unclassified Schaalia TaxID=2691889 RepID=UPI0013ED6038|nr:MULTISPECIES: DeoR/GlpR family DNA-binding transcription regulator [unclassified Schaalia]QPK80901.1 DeoR/GlpR transcriptional regulator [Schaalia sp. ZJ405]
MNRQERILALLEETGFVTVSSLAAQLRVNVSTIRRDLAQMAHQGLLQRTHGGAIPLKERTLSTVTEVPHLQEKRAIGPAMAERILEDQTVFLDTGTTCLEVARALNQEHVTIVTHDLLIAMEVLRHPSLNLVFVGGELLPTSTHMWGPTAIDQIDKIRVNVAIFGASSIMQDGIYGNGGYSLELQRKVRSIASEAFFVADSTKFGRQAMYKILGIEDFTAGITDSLLTPMTAASYPIPLIRAHVEFPPGDTHA